MKKCKQCKLALPVTAFDNAGRGRWKQICRTCTANAQPPAEPTVVLDYQRQCVVQTIPFSHFKNGQPKVQTLGFLTWRGYKISIVR